MASFLLFFFPCQRSLLLIPLLLAIISSKLFFLFLFHSEKIVFRKKKKYWGRIFSFHWWMVWNLANGWEIICSWTQLAGAKAKEKTLRVWQKPFPLAIFHWLVAQLLYLYWAWMSIGWLHVLQAFLTSALFGLVRAPRRFGFKNHSWSQELLLLVPLYSFLCVPVY